MITTLRYFEFGSHLTTMRHFFAPDKLAFVASPKTYAAPTVFVKDENLN